MQLTVVVNADDIARVSFLHVYAFVGHEGQRIGNLHFTAFAHMTHLHAGLVHAGAYAAKDLMDRYHINIDDIAEIKICSFMEAIRLPYSEPSNTENAQYNIGFPIASYLIFGQVGPRQVLNEYKNAKVLSLMSKMKVEHDPELQAIFPTTTKTRLEITMNDGTVYKSEAMQPEGDYDYKPFGDDAIKEKYMNYVTPVIGEDSAERLYTNIMQLETFDKAADILEGLNFVKK